MQTAATQPERRVVDASVAAKWHLRDEADVAAADAVLADFVAGHLDLLAPSHLRFELLNAINVARHRGRITPEAAMVGATDALALAGHNQPCPGAARR